MNRGKLILKTFAIFILICGTLSGLSQEIPDKPNPPRLVNDFAGLLDREEVNALEQKLVAFSDSTTTQIAVVIVRDLGGYDKADYAQRLGEKWGIGQKGKNNGILILIKTKTPESKGEVYITAGGWQEGGRDPFGLDPAARQRRAKGDGDRRGDRGAGH